VGTRGGLLEAKLSKTGLGYGEMLGDRSGSCWFLEERGDGERYFGYCMPVA